MFDAEGQQDYIGAMNQPLTLPPTVVAETTDPHLQPIVESVAQGLATRRIKSKDLKSFAANTLLVAPYADPRNHDLILGHLTRGIKTGLAPETLWADVNHAYLNPGNALRRPANPTHGRVVLGGPAPTYWPGSQKDPLAKLTSHGITPAPWKTQGTHVLICPPQCDLIPFLESWSQLRRPGLATFDFDEWADDIRDTAQRMKMPVIWRQRFDQTALETHLDQAAMVATTQSAVGPQALAMGIPTLGVPDLCPIATATGTVEWPNPIRAAHTRNHTGILANLLDCQAPLGHLRNPTFMRAMLNKQVKDAELATQGGKDEDGVSLVA